MNSDAQTAAVNSAQIQMLLESSARIENVLTELGRAQIQTEEKRAADKEVQDRLWAYIEKVEKRAEAAEKAAGDAKSQSLSNAKWINFGVAIATGIAIFIGNQVVSFIGGGKP